MSNTIRSLAAQLRVAGFKHDSYTRHIDGNVSIYKRDCPEVRRTLEVQLWQDGAHCVSHWKDGATERGVMDTVPTYFWTAEETRVAIEREKNRTK